jgi:hypothetical protein
VVAQYEVEMLGSDAAGTAARRVSETIKSLIEAAMAAGSLDDDPGFRAASGDCKTARVDFQSAAREDLR